MAQYKRLEEWMNDFKAMLRSKPKGAKPAVPKAVEPAKPSAPAVAPGFGKARFDPFGATLNPAKDAAVGKPPAAGGWYKKGK